MKKPNLSWRGFDAPAVDKDRVAHDAAKMTRRDFVRACALAGISAPLAGSLYNQASAETPRPGGTLRIAVDGGSATDSVDPALCTNNACTIMLKQWGTMLTRLGPDSEAVGLLAESFEPADDKGAKWAFQLHRGATFSNGKDVTAADVVATIRRHSDENAKSGALGILRGIVDVAADGKHKVLFTLDGANADFPFLMSDYHLVIQPADSEPNDPIGAGPYIMEESEHGVRYLARKNPNYFGQPGHVDEIETLVINDTTARVTALTTGQAHMISRVDPKIVGQLKRVSDVKIQIISGRGHYVFVCHADTAPFDNRHLRLALKFAIDREDMVKRILHGYGGVGNDFPINAAYPLFPADIPQRAYDPDKARHHYKKSGHSGSILLRTAENAFTGAVDAAVLYQSHAKKAGIDMEIKREPDDGYWKTVWNVQPFCASYWTGRAVQDQMYTAAYKSDADWNDTKWRRPKFDALLLKARAEFDTRKRRALYHEMALMVRDDGGVIVPMFNDFIDATRGVGGYRPHPGGKFSDDFAPVEVWLEG